MARYHVTVVLWIVSVTAGCPASVESTDQSRGLDEDAVVTRLDQLSRRIDDLELRLSDVEGQRTTRVPLVPSAGKMRTMGPYLIDEHGFLYDKTGRRVGVWGVNGQLISAPAVEPELVR